ncbi:MAG: DMT family transporter [Pseudomonadota bacterium]
MTDTRLWGLVALTMVAFASNSILTRMGIVEAGAGPLAFALVRTLSGAFMLGMLVIVQGGTERLRSGLSWVKPAGLATYMVGFSLAYLSLDAGLGALILFGGVQITMFAAALVAREPMGPRRIGGSLVAMAGLIWLLWPTGDFAVPLVGASLMLAAALGWGSLSVMGRGTKDPLADMAGCFVLATLPVAVFAVVAWDGMTPAGFALAVVSGAVTSGLGYALWYLLLPQLEASAAAVAQLTVPPIALAGGLIVLAEAPTLRFALASAVILGGVLWAILPKKTS